MKHVPEKYQDDKWTGFMEVDFTMADIKRLAAEGVETSKAIHRGVFEANPMPKHCRTCPYESVCEERQEQKARNAAKRGLRKTKTPDPTEGNDGFVDLSFGSKT
tara:strand:- start:158 stop:469 length:312 start_codon:yes stop_codon:yes gene_type:complete